MYISIAFDFHITKRILDLAMSKMLCNGLYPELNLYYDILLVVRIIIIS